MNNRIISFGYIGFGLIYFLLSYFGKTEITWYLKPFLLPILMLLVSNFDAFPTKKWLLSALIFSWIGDVILLFASKSEIYFILGLIAFLIAHLLYIVLFWKQNKTEDFRKKRLFWVATILTLFYLKELTTLLWPTLGGLKIHVFVYAITISVMLIVALKGYFSWGKTSGLWIVFGAMSFIASDSFLAINKFSAPFENANLWIMVTYITAQFCITSGILELNKFTKN